MKIGIVLYPTFGGSGVVATELGLALARRGHSVHFISYRPPARLEVLQPVIHYHEVVVPDYPLFDFLPYETALSSQIVDVTLEEDLDIIHAHYALPHATAAFLAREILADKGKSIPILTTLHGTDITLVGRDPSFAHTLRYVLKHSNGITAVSNFLKKETESLFPETKPIKVIHNFIHLSKFRGPSPDDCIKKYLSKQGEFVLSHISNFRPVKRIQDVVDIFRLVNEKVPAVLLMVGDGPEKPLAEVLVRKYGLQKKVLFLGNLVEAYSVLSCTDFYLLPSNRESFGLSALEALASGVPVAGYNVGGLTEIIDNEQTGFLAEIGDTEGLANAIIDVFLNPEKLALLKNQSRKKASMFSDEIIVPLYEEIYASLIF